MEFIHHDPTALPGPLNPMVGAEIKEMRTVRWRASSASLDEADPPSLFAWSTTVRQDDETLDAWLRDAWGSFDGWPPCSVVRIERAGDQAPEAAG